MLGQSLFWRKVLSSPVLVWVIDFMLDFLFGWKTKNIDPKEKPMLYAHLYSYSSVKCLVHWFQITKTQKFQAFDDNITVRETNDQYRDYVLPSYLPSRIVCPIAIFYGGEDTVPEMGWLLKQMPEGSFIHREDSYEHLDFMWASNVNEVVDEKVVQLLHNHNKQENQLSSDNPQNKTKRA